jgi:SAM-dependent methyltransferase
MDLRPGQRILDLGCGAAATSIFLAHEYGVEVWAADLWFDPEENRKRIEDAGVAASVFAHRTEAHRLPFEMDFFDAIVSIDAYHYFGTEVRYLSYLSQFVRQGGEIGIVVPGNVIDPDEPDAIRLDQPLARQIGADWFTFRSAEWWHRHWSYTHCVDVEFAGMLEGGDDDWQRWIAATTAAYGMHTELQTNAQMLASPAGKSLGFCVAKARRNDQPAINFGIDEFENRIA